jgi:hypothetical protein
VQVRLEVEKEGAQGGEVAACFLGRKVSAPCPIDEGERAPEDSQIDYSFEFRQGDQAEVDGIVSWVGIGPELVKTCGGGLRLSTGILYRFGCGRLRTCCKVPRRSGSSTSAFLLAIRISVRPIWQEPFPALLLGALAHFEARDVRQHGQGGFDDALQLARGRVVLVGAVSGRGRVGRGRAGMMSPVRLAVGRRSREVVRGCWRLGLILKARG